MDSSKDNHDQMVSEILSKFLWGVKSQHLKVSAFKQILMGCKVSVSEILSKFLWGVKFQHCRWVGVKLCVT